MGDIYICDPFQIFDVLYLLRVHANTLINLVGRIPFNLNYQLIKHKIVDSVGCDLTERSAMVICLTI